METLVLAARDTLVLARRLRVAMAIELMTACPDRHGDHLYQMQRLGGSQQWILFRCGDCASVSEHLISDAQAAVVDAELER